ncbi:drug resistance transporter, EmrB/QacA subfamily [Thermanaeromonas toyohensis ToBE]|uniref:Drug resistance transporter, EmrB/QacA subfamily n=1 Tax=Thermanaeromonas toyohensis ToBE TaxID=698762 RepID=A0A1W1V9G1_9FIRM|nr:DHA2 family efflux MFS transporter permease subunit [Thermanaeromonas toyohensis]SMB89840.1 drug resistance transporter, EmrB/QacA subfamily [Thermanaeromonas toyohensis ToBE]
MEEAREKGKLGKSPSSFWALPVLVALIGPFMAILDSSIVNVAIPTIMRVFNTDTATVEWVVTIYMLSLGVVVPLSGWMGDRLGLKRLYILSLAIFTLGSFLCAFSFNIYSLIAARVIQAVGGGMIMPTTMAMIYRMVPRERFGSAMGVFGIAILVAPAIGPTLGGYLVEYVDWRWIFTINLPVGLLGILLSLFFLPEFPGIPIGHLDIGGAVTSGTGLFCLLLALSKGNDWGWRQENTVLLLYTSAVCLGLFVYLELTQENPLLDLRVFRYPTFTLANLMVILTTISLFAGVFYVPLFLQTVKGLGAMETGLLMMPAALTSGLLMPITGRLYDRVGPKPLCLAGLLLLAYTTYQFHNLDIVTSTNSIKFWLVLRSIGMSMAMMPAQTAALAVIPVELVGRASAITNIINRVSGSFGIAVLTAILTNRQALHSAHLAWQITGTNPAVQYFLQQAGPSPSLGLVYLNGIVQRASFIRALNDIFVIMAVLALTGLLPSFFLEKGRDKPSPLVGSE